MAISDILELISEQTKDNNEKEDRKDNVIETKSEIMRKQDIVEEFIKFIKQINAFSYYNELGDEFSFSVSDEKIKSEKIVLEEGMNYPIFFNILVIGQT